VDPEKEAAREVVFVSLGSFWYLGLSMLEIKLTIRVQKLRITTIMD
jgi:hypothetical protein